MASSFTQGREQHGRRKIRSTGLSVEKGRIPHKDPERAIAYFAARYQAKKAEISEQKKRAYATDPDATKLRVRKYRESHPELCLVSRRTSGKKKYWENPQKYLERKSRYRALKVGTQVEPIDFMQILKDSKGICGICMKPFDLFGIEFDHIIPLSRGGTHTVGNIQASHARCNRSKGAKVG